MNDSDISPSEDPWLLVTDRDQRPVIDENDMKFSDNFEPRLTDSPRTSSQELISDSLHSLPDSQQYIRSLEKKLEKLKGRTKEMSSKDVMNSLSAKRDAILQQLLHSTDSHNYCPDFENQTHDSSISNNSTIYQIVERRLFPQMQALTEEELQKLLESDILQKVTSNTNQINE